MSDYITQQLIADHVAEQQRRKEFLRKLRAERKSFVLAPAVHDPEYQMSSAEIDRHIMEARRPE